MLETFLPQFIASLILGFLFANYFNGKVENEKIERGSRFGVGKYRIVMHNWIWSLAILSVCLILHIYDSITLGVISGAIIQGLTYRDRFVIIYKADDFEKIYQKFLK